MRLIFGIFLDATKLAGIVGSRPSKLYLCVCFGSIFVLESKMRFSNASLSNDMDFLGKESSDFLFNPW